MQTLTWAAMEICELRNINCEIKYIDRYQTITTQPAEHNLELSKQLSTFRSNPLFSDVTICATFDGQEFPAHRVILASRSTVFAAMFNHADLEENQKGRVEIPDVSGQVLEAFLAYLYSNDLSAIDQYCTKLLDLADKVLRWLLPSIA